MVRQDLVDLRDHVLGVGVHVAALVHDDFHVVLPGSGQLAPGAVLDTRVDEVQVIKDALECRLLLQELLALIGLQHGVTGGQVAGALGPLHIDLLAAQELQELPCSVLGGLIVLGGDAQHKLQQYF